MSKFKNTWKAIMGFIAPGATVIIAATTEGSAGGDKITKAEWIIAACTAIVTAASVYSTPPGKNLKTPQA